jgi:ribosome maturation factor RimP
MGRASHRRDLHRLVEPAVRAAGMDVEDVTISAVGRRRVLRVVVDSDGGARLDDVAALSEVLSAELDRTAAMGEGPYVLEVTSPGVDRPLTELRHWRRAVGRLVTAALADGTTQTGRVVAAADTGLTLDGEAGRRHLGWHQVSRGRVEVEFARPAAMGEVTGAEDSGDEVGPWTST